MKQIKAIHARAHVNGRNFGIRICEKGNCKGTATGIVEYEDDTAIYVCDKHIPRVYPMKFKVTKQFLEEFEGAESGRHEDALLAREKGDQEEIEASEYQVVCGDFLDRWKTQIEVRNDEELVELYYGLASGTIGIRGFTKQANKIIDQIRDDVRNCGKRGEYMVRVWPRQDGF